MQKSSPQNIRFAFDMDYGKNIHLKNFYYKNDKIEVSAKKIDIFYDFFNLLLLKFNKIEVEEPEIKIIENNEENKFLARDLVSKFYIPSKILNLSKIKILLNKNDYISIDSFAQQKNNFRLQQFVHFSSNPYIRAFNLEGNIKKQHHKIYSEAELTDVSNFIKLNFKINLSTSGHEGEFSAESNELDFSKNVFQPENISPRYLSILKDTTGKFKIKGFYKFSKDSQNSGLDLKLDNLSLSIGSTYIKDISGQVNLDNLFPLHSFKEQTITVKNIINPILLDAGEIKFSFANNTMNIKHAKFNFGEGSFNIKDSVIDLANLPNTNIDAFVTDVKIVDLVPFNEIEFAAEGNISGKLTLGIKEYNLILKNGYLSSPQKGIIKYKPVSAALKSNQSLSYILKAAENFHYDILKADIASKDGINITVSFDIFGYNPTFLNGKPFSIKVNVDGNLLDILRKSVKTYDLPQNIIEKMNNESHN
jgi:hypothetical protein